MAIQKGNKYLFLMLIALSFFSCRDQVQKRIDNILDPQSIIDVDDKLYWGGELPEIVVLNSSEL